jgi:large subunit ribosomal protein L1
LDVAKAVQEIKNGKIEYRTDKVGNIHAPIGRVSFTETQLKENAKTIYEQLNRIKPTTVKGTYMKNITVTSSMAPGIHMDEESLKARG